MSTYKRNRGVARHIATRVLSRDNFKCVKCNSRVFLEIHHIRPVYLSGNDNLDNLITLCKTCHRGAPDNILEFLKYMANPYTPTISAIRDASFITFKASLSLEGEELLKAKENPEKYFSESFDLIFKGLLRIIYSSEEE